MNARRWAPIVLGCLGPLLLAFIWLQTRLSQGAASTGQASVGRTSTMVLVDHTERVRTRAGRVAWQFHAGEVELLLSGDYLIRTLDRGEFLQNDLPSLIFRADRGRFEARTQNVALRGQVRVESPQGLRIEADEMFWFDAADQLVVPAVRRLAWQDPIHPEQPAATIATERLFLKPGERTLELPDPLTGEQGPQTLAARSARMALDGGRIDLTGPARLSLMAPVDLGGNTATRRVNLGVGTGGQLGYNTRTGGAVLAGQVTIELPGDQVGLTCDEASYSGGSDGLVKAGGKLVLTDPQSQITARRVTVTPRARRAVFEGPVALSHRTDSGDSLTIEAPAMTFWYGTGARRVSASRVRFRSTETSGEAGQAEVDLEAERVVLTTRVVLEQAATPDREAVTVRCGRLDYRFAAGGRIAVATGQPTFRQGELQGSARRLEWAQDAGQVTLTGQVRLRDARGQRARCERLRYHLETGDLQIEAPASAELYFADEDITGR